MTPLSPAKQKELIKQSESADFRQSQQANIVLLLDLIFGIAHSVEPAESERVEDAEHHFQSYCAIASRIQAESKIIRASLGLTERELEQVAFDDLREVTARAIDLAVGDIRISDPAEKSALSGKLQRLFDTFEMGFREATPELSITNATLERLRQPRNQKGTP